MRRSVVPVSLLLLSGLAIYACGSDTLAPTETSVVPNPSGSLATTSDGSGSATTDDPPQERGKANKVNICHIPRGNLGNVQLINVSGNAVPAHQAHGDYFQLTFYPDSDGDGHGASSGSVEACVAPAGFVDQTGDCDDTNPTVHPGAPEICGDGIDNDCDGQIDEGCAPPVADCPCQAAYAAVVFPHVRLECRDDANQTVLDDSPIFISMIHFAGTQDPRFGGLPRCTAVGPGVNVEVTGLSVAEDLACTQLIRARAIVEGAVCPTAP